MLVALAAIASAALPYISARYSALAAGAPDLEQMTARAQTAATLDPTTAEPFGVRADAYIQTASQAADATERLRLLAHGSDRPAGGSRERARELGLPLPGGPDAV